jgi:uncharacterized protein YndB with AHSA1/START domain
MVNRYWLRVDRRHAPIQLRHCLYGGTVMPASGDTAKPSLTLERRLGARANQVYAAWTKPEMIVKWFGPDAGAVHHAETDVRTGGRYAIAFDTMDGESHHVSGIYREVVPDEKLVFTWMWHTLPDRESLVTILIKPDGDGSMLTLIHEQFFDEGARDRHREGWTGSLDKLERFLA